MVTDPETADNTEESDGLDKNIKFLTFSLLNEEYAIDILCVNEIISIHEIIFVPDLPVFVKGVINLRGMVIPVMDVRMRFSLPLQEYGSRTCIIVIDINDIHIGLLVDEVKDVIDLANENIEPPPRTGLKTKSRFISGIGKIDGKVLIILKSEQLLYDEEQDNIKKELQIEDSLAQNIDSK